MSKYKRVLLKVSGETLSTENGYGIDQNKVDLLCDQLIRAHKTGVEIGIVVGGGNIWRGRLAPEMDRTTADHMGMLATVINALALQDALERKGVPTRVQTALEMPRIAEPYILRRTIRHLEKARIVIFGCGTGNPYFSTDSGAALRACEIHADVLLMAKNIDGIYTADPKIDKTAKKIEHMSYLEYIQQNLKAVDVAAVSMCNDYKLPIVAFGIQEKDSIYKALTGEVFGTRID